MTPPKKQSTNPGLSNILNDSLSAMINYRLPVTDEQSLYIDKPGSSVDATLLATRELTHFPLLLGVPAPQHLILIPVLVFLLLVGTTLLINFPQIITSAHRQASRMATAIMI